MKATEARILELLKLKRYFFVPIYQRTYSWTSKQCDQLWKDIVRVGKDEQLTSHFLGSIIYKEEGQSTATKESRLMVIDGQQRLTTITLLIAALSEMLGEEELEGFSKRKLRENYLLNSLESGRGKCKLILSQTDRDSLINIVEGAGPPPVFSIKIYENLKLFQQKISEYGRDSKSLKALCDGLKKLFIVDIELKSEDNAQLIFESMNSTGLDLSQADLIRNFILMDLETETQKRLYRRYWRPMEQEFGQEGYSLHFDPFMRHYLVVKTGDIPKKKEVYEEFKSLKRKEDTNGENSTEKLVEEVGEYSSHFCAIALGKEQDQELNDAFQDIKEYKIDVSYPFLLELYRNYMSEKLSKSDFLEIIRMTESYVFRRWVCNIPTNSLDTTFAALTRSLRKDNHLESVKEQFLDLPTYRRFPNDSEFERMIKERDLYNNKRCSYWLRRFENFERKERVNIKEYTIEHIMPQNKNLPLFWQKELGEDWKNVHDTLLHTLGNLTLTGYNSEFGDRSFKDKRDMKGGFRESPIRLNANLRELEIWNGQAIEKRADDLAMKALRIWPRPVLDNLENRVVQPVLEDSQYTIKDHSNLSKEPMKELFEIFDSIVMGLDQCVKKEFQKLTVAYKAGSNFADLVPLKKELKIYLNMNFSEIYDPKGICRDVSEKGHWGNSDVEVRLSSHEDIPYVVDLVRQSLKRQLGGEESI